MIRDKLFGSKQHVSMFRHDEFAAGISDPAEYASRYYHESKGLIATIEEVEPVSRSIEIGAGYGRLSPWVADRSAKHICVEPNDWARECGRELYPRIGWVDGIAQDLQFSENEFNLGLSWTVLQHLPEDDTIKAIDELKRVVDGSIICCEETPDADGQGPGIVKGFNGTIARTIADYEKMFEPFELVRCVARPLERTYPRRAGHIMTFQQ